MKYGERGSMTKNQWLKHKRKIKYGVNPTQLQRGRRKRLIERDGEFCKVCNSHEDLTVDHILRSCDGGSTELENLQLLCQKCNRQKNKEEQKV